jgi:hypothetical protein
MLKTIDYSLSSSGADAANAETAAVSLLQLLARVEAAAANPQSLSEFSPSAFSPSPALSVYQEEMLETITQAVFSSVNDDFYAAYKGYGPEKLFEIVVSEEDLRPLAYRAMTQSAQDLQADNAGPRHFAPRFAQALLLLQKHWNSEFLQPYKDVAGNISAYSIKRRQLTVAFDR